MLFLCGSSYGLHRKILSWPLSFRHSRLSGGDSEKDIWSIRITLGIRALGVLNRDTVTWFWIGNHDDYERSMPHLTSVYEKTKTSTRSGLSSQAVGNECLLQGDIMIIYDFS